MFLLLLMGLGAAGVKAQVRIGGNTAPSKAAVLDLNATDAANTGTGGLVLPRVDLTSNTMQLTNGVANVTGTMVYNTTATLGQIGVYYWNGNRWVLASLPATSASDSGDLLMSNGTTVVWHSAPGTTILPDGSIIASGSYTQISWYTVLFNMPRVTAYLQRYALRVPSTIPGDVCVHATALDNFYIQAAVGSIELIALSVSDASTAAVTCYRFQ